VAETTSLSGPRALSVGLPVRNAEADIGAALESLLGQTVRDIEILVSDNASTDRTFEICSEYARRDPRVKVQRHPRDVGLYANFAAVLERANAPLFMFAAHDDRWHPEFAERLVERLAARPEAVAAMSAVEVALPGREPHGVVEFSGPRNPERKGRLRLALAVALAQTKLNYWIYGVFHTAFLRRAWRIPNVVMPDRLFVLQVVLAGEIAYVDRILHTRRIRSATGPRLGLRELLRRWVAIAVTVPYLISSPVVPARYKVVAPLLVAPMLLRSVVETLPFRLGSAGRPAA
jgi:glycosyltransferase involved in cell wall biosynthesis